MQWEYFCDSCGLFFWGNKYVQNSETGRMQIVPGMTCPNSDCESHKMIDKRVFAVETYAYDYFCYINPGFVDAIKWSSRKFVPEDILAKYREQGMRIIE